MQQTIRCQFYRPGKISLTHGFCKANRKEVHKDCQDERADCFAALKAKAGRMGFGARLAKFMGMAGV